MDDLIASTSPSLDPRITWVEQAVLNASAAGDELERHGWLLRTAPVPSKRARCVYVLAPAELELRAQIDDCSQWYAKQGQPFIVRLSSQCPVPDMDAYLISLGFEEASRAQAMLGTITLPSVKPRSPDAASLSCSEMSADAFFNRLVQWTGRSDSDAADRYAKARQERDVHTSWITLRNAQGQDVGVGSLIYDNGLAGIYDLCIDPAYRRQGYGEAMVLQLLTLAQRREPGVQPYLLVEQSNTPAVALYKKLGFTPLYEYWFRCAVTA